MRERDTTRLMPIRNVLLDCEGHVKLTDFGFAKASRLSRPLCSIASNRNPLRSMRWWKRGPGLFVAHLSAPCEICISFLELSFCFEPVRRGTWRQRLFSLKDMERQRVYCTMRFLLFGPFSLHNSPGPGS